MLCTFEDAIKQIKSIDAGHKKSDLELGMDEWFIHNLPLEVALADCIRNEGGSNDGDKVITKKIKKRSASLDLGTMYESVAYNDQNIFGNL